MTKGSFILGVLAAISGSIGIIWLLAVLDSSILTNIIEWSGISPPEDPYLGIARVVIVGGMFNFIDLNPFAFNFFVILAWFLGGFVGGIASRREMAGIKVAVAMSVSIFLLGYYLLGFTIPSFAILLFLFPFISQVATGCAISSIGGIIGGHLTEVKGGL